MYKNVKDAKLLESTEFFGKKFLITENAGLSRDGPLRLTFSGMGVYQPALFANCTPGAFPLAPLLRAAMDAGQVTGEHYTGPWFDIGTPERLDEVNRVVINLQ